MVLAIPAYVFTLLFSLISDSSGVLLANLLARNVLQDEVRKTERKMTRNLEPEKKIT